MSEIPHSKIQVLQAEDLLAEFELVGDRELILGRSQAADVIVPHRSVSGVHARVYLRQGDVFLEDLSSTHGTFIDGQRVDEEQRLRHGQKILLGQHSVLRPVLLRFVDPASKLLSELGLPDEAATAQETAPEAQSADHESAAGSAASPSDQEPTIDTKTGAPEAKATDTAKQPALGLGTGRRQVAVAAAAMIFLAVAAWGLSEMLRPSSTTWRSVQASPAVLMAGNELSLQSPEIHPRDLLTILIAGEGAELQETRRGRLKVLVPDLVNRSSGVHSVPLVVRRDGREIYQRMLQYVVQPRLSGVHPPRVEVGEVLEIQGSGFGTALDNVRIRFGNREAQPISATSTRMQVQVPPITDRHSVRVAVDVMIGDWQATLPELLEVLPRELEPLAFQLEASYDVAREAWLVSQPFGDAFHLPGPAPGGSESPKQVQRVLAAWATAFELATRDRELTLDVQPRRQRVALVASSRLLNEALELVSWSRRDLSRLVDAEQGSLALEMYCYWMARVWTDFLEVFSRGRSIPETSRSASYVPVLNELVRRNLEGGGSGRPEWREVEMLDPEQQLILADAFTPEPQSVATLSGTWHALLENVFYPDQEYRVEVALELSHQGKGLRGTARVALKSEAMDWGLEPAQVTGSLELGVPPEIRLEIPFKRPVGTLVLTGTLDGSSLDGQFEVEGSTRSAQWKAYRVAGEELAGPKAAHLADWSQVARSGP